MAMTPEVSDLVNKIKTEQSANKMRGYIADGLQKTNEETTYTSGQLQNVIEATTDKDFTSAPEIIAARKSKPNLNARLDSFEQSTTAQFQQTDKETRKKSELLGLNDFDAKALTAIEGGVGANFEINAVPKDHSVTAKKTTFLEESYNIINLKGISNKKKIKESDGTLVESTNSSVTDFISLTGGKPYIGDKLNTVAYYTEDKTFISVAILADNVVFTPPSNTFFGRFKISDVLASEQFTVNEGTTLKPFEPYWVSLKKEIGANPSENSVNTFSLIDNSVTEDKVSFLKKGTNIFNKKKITKGKVISADGSIVENVNYSFSGFIPVERKKDYTTKDVSFIAYYDKDKNFIRRINGVIDGITNIEIPLVVYYIVLILNTNKTDFDVDLIQLNKGNVLLNFEPYTITLDENIKMGSSITTNENEFYTIAGSLNGYYEQKTLLPARVRQDSIQIYAYFDALMAEFPHYITKIEIGKSVQLRPIYKYTLTPPKVQSTFNRVPRMILTSAIHGIEAMSMEILKNFTNNLARNWKESELLETLRWNVIIDIVPVVSPDGVEVHSRLNANGKDLNRDFPVNFKQTEFTEASPLSQPESVALYNMIKGTENLIYYSDGHNFSPRRTDLDRWQLIWNNGNTDLNLETSNSLIRTTSQKWKQKYDFLPQDETTLFGYSTKITEGGTVSEYVNSLGIESSVFETGHAIDEYDTADGNYGTNAVSMFTEVLTNWVAMVLKNHVM